MMARGRTATANPELYPGGEVCGVLRNDAPGSPISLTKRYELYEEQVQRAGVRAGRGGLRSIAGDRNQLAEFDEAESSFELVRSLEQRTRNETGRGGLRSIADIDSGSAELVGQSKTAVPIRGGTVSAPRIPLEPSLAS